jgi:hypothetical protein
MKKSSAYLALFVFMITVCSIFAFSQESDLTGTWEGSTVIPDQGEDEVILVITEKEGELAATMSDSLGMLTDIECEDIEFEDGALTFNFTITQEMESQTVWITLELEDDILKGYWETGDGGQGDIELKKQ